jgi:isocitrate dehydrogenase
MLTTNELVKENTPTNAKAVKIAVAKGDGIGPEIMKATLRILEAAGAMIEPEYIELGEKVYLAGQSAGIDKKAWEVIRNNKIILKAPITTPQGKGYKSLNVTLRKSLGLFANIRPVQTLAPFVEAGHPSMDVVIVRENEEDLYAGIEHQQTQDVVQCLKLIESDSQIIDIGAARLAAHPGRYDVIVTSNLYGDIISDIVAEVAGSVGLAGSANIGKKVAMFEAIHGSAPDITGQGIANPSGLLNGAIMMLNHIGQPSVAQKIKKAWLTTIEEGYHTADIYQEGSSKKKVSTQEFADEIIARIEAASQDDTTVENNHTPIYIPEYNRPQTKKVLVGSDLFIDWQGSNPEEIGTKLDALEGTGLQLKMITNRGVKVYPNGMEETYCTDHWRCRFISAETDTKTKPVSYQTITHQMIWNTLAKIEEIGLDVIKTENLYEFDGKRGFSLGQGE